MCEPSIRRAFANLSQKFAVMMFPRFFILHATVLLHVVQATTLESAEPSPKAIQVHTGDTGDLKQLVQYLRDTVSPVYDDSKKLLREAADSLKQVNEGPVSAEETKAKK